MTIAESAQIITAVGAMIAALTGAAGFIVSVFALLKAGKAVTGIAAVGVKINGLLADRDVTKIDEGKRQVRDEQAAAKDVSRMEAVKDAVADAKIAAAGTPQTNHKEG